MKIIVDMMGGDNAPLAVLEGAAQAVKEYGITVVGVGDEALVRKTAQENSIPLDGIELVNCTEVIDMCDEPASAIRQKKDSSIVVGLNMLKDGKGDAFVSAGSTGALHVGASLIVRTLKGIKRPALATMVPAKKQAYLLLDCGANVECRPEMLAAFAVMGSCYVNKVEGRCSPSVALANNGAEESKGTPMLKEAHQLLKTTPGIRFVGNIEPRDVPGGEVDVVVCDGFTGNVILKLTEGVAKMLLGMLKQMFLANLGGKLAYLLLKGSVADLKHQMDSEEYGGAPFLGAKQPVIKAHGSSKAKGIKNAIRQAKICVENDLCGTMQSALDELAAAQKTEEFSARLGFPVKLDYQLPPRFVPSHQAIHLLQIAREALSNVLKHAEATAVTVTVSCQDNQVKLRVQDNGRGVPENAERTNHYGLIIMRDRAQSLRGDCQVRRGESGGTEVVVTFIPEKPLITAQGENHD